MSSLFDAYGVAGIKLKQYLAFTSQFSAFREAFESAQDSASPLSYEQVIRLLQQRFGQDWDDSWQVDKVLGSGSVNVAVRTVQAQTGESQVLSVQRPQVEVTADYDFHRFQRFLAELIQTPEDESRYGYLRGLAKIVQGSVALEFDKQAALAIQQQVQPLYQREVQGWQVKTVAASGSDHQTLRMQEAEGVTARRLRQSDPASYRAALRALSQVEMDRLLGIGADGRAQPVATHANPDFHDGQVLVDVATKSVTLLDFGQAVPISNDQREFALDLLGICSKAYRPQGAAALLNRGLPEVARKFQAGELEQLLQESPETMDRFVRLVALIEERGGEVPLASLHWVLAVQRQVALGQRIGAPHRETVAQVLLSRRLGGGLAGVNRHRLALRSLGQLGSSLLGPLGQPLQQALQQSLHLGLS